MLITEQYLRDRIRKPQTGMKVTLPDGCRFSPSAEEFIKLWQVEIVSETAGTSQGSSAEWDKPGSFPVKITREIAEFPKKENETQLNAERFVPKNTPRIRFRGRLDTLQAAALILGSMVRRQGEQKIADLIDTVCAYIREILSAEYNEREPAPLLINGLDESGIREVTHHPDAHLGVEHIVPSAGDDPVLLHLNQLRCMARETELYALDVYAPPPDYIVQENPGIVQAVNRLSSVIYFLELLYITNHSGNG
jgi:ethanolamine utilization cobalamin adenosyltransferase